MVKSVKLFLIVNFLLVHIVYAQSSFQNIQISNTGGPNEVTIVMNPKNTNKLVAGSNINQYYYSTNAGYNWVQGILTSTYGVNYDPCVVVDTAGAFYYFHLSNPVSGGYLIDRIVCQKSLNDGMSWSNGTFFGYNPPRAQHVKEWACVDWSASPRRNYIYVTWSQFDQYNSTSNNDSSNILFVRSSNGGTTWSTPLRINQKAGTAVDGDNAVEGAVPCVGPSGEIYTSWAGPVGPGGIYGIVFDKSTDGGITWLANDIYVSDEPGGWLYTVPGVIQVLGCPVTDCDRSTGPYRGTIYINWTDQRNGATDTDVWLVKSTNGGASWSALNRVNSDSPGKHQFMSWMTVDQVTGYLYFVFYDRRNYTDNQNDVYLAYSTDGGTTFVNTRISQSPFTTLSGVLLGHYLNISAHNNIIRPIWTRWFSGALSIWTAITDNIVGISLHVPLVPKEFILEQNFPNPFNPSTKIRFALPSNVKRETSNVKLVVYDMLGREVVTLVNEQLKPGTYEADWNASNYPSGVYYYKLITENFSQSLKMILIK